MKKIGFVIVLVIGVLVMATSFTYDNFVAPNEMPPAAQLFIQNHFPDSKVTLVEKDINFLSKEYTICLSDGTKIDFDTNGDWKEVDCRFSAVPIEVIPEPIAAYVTANFKDFPVVEIIKTRRTYKVELANGIDLRFSKYGHLLDSDD